MKHQESLQVAIDAQVLPWRNGGVAHALLALVRTLGEISSEQDSYKLIVESEEEAAFWRPELAKNQAIVLRSEHRPQRIDSGVHRTLGSRAKSVVQPFARAIKRRLATPQKWPEVPISNGFYESLGCNVLHIPWQNYFLTSIPTIYNPHDLQHLYYPNFFTPQELAWKETMYHMGCRMARTVAVGSQWAKDDFVRQYALDPAKVQVIPEGPQIKLAPPLPAEVVEEVKKRHQLPEIYLFYPAILWPHKNHSRLLDALAVLRDERGLNVSLVCTGTKRKEYWPDIERQIKELRLEQAVHFLGFVSETDLAVIQRRAHALVQTSLFEASSLPIFDAWLEGVPVACSRVTALPEQVGKAGLLFDPMDARDIANVIAQILTSSETRQELAALGARRLQDFDWKRTAKAYRALYRRAAHFALTEEEQWLLQWDWMRDPDRKPVPGNRS